MPETLNETDGSMLPPRRALLPWWIIFFCWALIFICSFQFIIASLEWINALYPVDQSPVDLNVFGIHLYRNADPEFEDVLSTANPLFTVIAAYGLLKEKGWAINIAITNAVVSAFDILYSPVGVTKGFMERMIYIEFFWYYYLAALVLLIIYLWKLIRIRKDWRIRQPRPSL